MTEISFFQGKKDLIRRNLTQYTRKAFKILPPLDKPRILDIGCGTGVPTMELARLSNGDITGLDIDRQQLELFRQKIEKEGVPHRVKAVEGSSLEMKFPDESFDIIWAEGSIFVLGFEKGIIEWKRFLKPNGYLVVHDDAGNITGKLRQIPNHGYDLLDYFELDEDIWWNEYYAPLEKLIYKFRTNYPDDPGASNMADAEQRELEMVKQNPGRCRSAYFIMKKR